MIKYLRCTEVNDDEMYEAFSKGFSDYIIKFEMEKEFFLSHFFGPEGNKREYSYIAIDDDKPVGLVLGGIRIFDELKTLRCGTMCVIPEYRGKGIAVELLKYHESIAKEYECKQMFLECIVGNDRALKFYENKGYYKVYDLNYFTKKDMVKRDSNIKTELMTIDELREFTELSDVHINWQNSLDYIENINPNIKGIIVNEEIIGAIAEKNNNIKYLYIKPNMRNRGYASALINDIIDVNRDKVSFSFTNNASLHGFIMKLGFEKDNISQYEMYKKI